MIKTVFLFLTVLLCCSIRAQEENLLKVNRMAVTVGVGMTWTGNEPFKTEQDELYYNPGKGTLSPRYSFLYAPVKLGFTYGLKRHFVLKAEYGISKVYSKIGTIYASPVQYWLIQEYHPYLVNTVSVGFQSCGKKAYARYKSPLKSKNYFVPTVINYYEVLYTHAFYRLQTEYKNDLPAVQLGTVSLGVYRNLFLRKTKLFFPFIGVRVGIPVYKNNKHIDYIPQNTEGSIVPKTTWKELNRQNAALNYFQLQFGLRYLIP